MLKYMTFVQYLDIRLLFKTNSQESNNQNRSNISPDCVLHACFHVKTYFVFDEDALVHV